jgi:DNA-binding NarL/FixJ family response regulator
MGTMSIRITLVEDTASLRKRFTELFAMYEEVELVATYASGEATLNGLTKMPPSKLPQVILMDIELLEMSGIETTRLVKERFPDIEVMMLTVFEDEAKIFQSIEAGASGYLLKDDAADDIVTAIKELHDGGAPMSQSIARKVLTMLKSSPAEKKTSLSPSEEFSLSVRELELLRGLVDGETYTSLAKILFLSPHTVKTHIKNIYKKLHVHTRATAVKTAIDRNLV